MWKRESRRATNRSAAIAIGASSALLLAACSGGGGGGAQADGPSVAPGATIEEYQAAFAEIDPITLRIQVTPAEGAPENEPAQRWADSIEEWSGGAITFEWGYSNAFVPNSGELFQALSDGRLDIAPSTVPYTNPTLFPKLTNVFNASLLDENTPASQLATPSWLTEMTLTDPELVAEAEAAGVQFLGVRPTFGVSVLQCPEAWTTLDELRGKTSFAAGPANVAQLEALGMSPTTIAYTELYESVERGIVECISMTVDYALISGLAGMLPHGMLSTETSFGSFPSWWTMSKVTWDGLPRIAQQLLIDRLDVIYGGGEPGSTDLEVKSTQLSDWLEQAGSKGGGFVELDAAASAALKGANDATVQALSNDVDLAAIEAAQAEWSAAVVDLYPDLPTDLTTFLADGGFASVDLQPWGDVVYEELLLSIRPS